MSRSQSGERAGTSLNRPYECFTCTAERKGTPGYHVTTFATLDELRAHKARKHGVVSQRPLTLDEHRARKHDGVTR